MRHIILALLLVGCADQPAHDYPCRMDCGGGPPKPEQDEHAGMVKVCDGRPGGRCTYVTPEELRRVLREAGLSR